MAPFPMMRCAVCCSSNQLLRAVMPGQPCGGPSNGMAWSKICSQGLVDDKGNLAFLRPSSLQTTQLLMQASLCRLLAGRLTVICAWIPCYAPVNDLQFKQLTRACESAYCSARIAYDQHCSGHLSCTQQQVRSDVGFQWHDG